MLRNSRLGAVLAIVGLAAVGTAALPAPAEAWWRGGWCCRVGVGIFVPPVVFAPPVYAPPPVYYPRRRWRTTRRSACGYRRIGKAAIGFPATGADHPTYARGLV